MKLSTRLIVLLLVAATATAAGFFYARSRVNSPPDHQALLQQAADTHAPKQAPNFALPGLDGKLHAMNQWHGRLRLLNFWATWCGPCREEIPALITLQDEFGADGLQVIGIATDEPDAKTVKNFAKQFKIDYPLLMDDDHAAGIARHLGFHLIGLPATVLIGPDARILGYHLGPIDAATMRAKITKLLNGYKKSTKVADQRRS